MSFLNIIDHYKNFNFSAFSETITDADIERALCNDTPDAMDFLALMSPKAEPLMEQMAQKAHLLTKQYFGKAILLYTPMYLSNYCENACVYCGFSTNNSIERKKLNAIEIQKEAECISSTGLKHILILTGESRKDTPIDYIKESVALLKKYFSSISIEIYPLNTDEYKELIDAGIDGLTLYQEVYDTKTYNTVHPKGPKNDYVFRLDAPEAACQAGIRTVNIGVLLGLNEWRQESFFCGLHAKYLQDKYRDVEVSLSVPRIRKHNGYYTPVSNVDDKALVQIILAYRNFLPRAGITLSTREGAALRENLLPLGITKMSAESSTAVGGRTCSVAGETVQFDILDLRNVGQIKNMLLGKGYQPVLKDWMNL